VPRKVFVAGEILTAADVNTNLMDQTVMVFDDAAARTTAIPSPVEGMVTYLKDTDKLDQFDGSNFVAVSQPGILQVVSATKTDASSETVSSRSAISGAVTGLSVTITPSSTSSKILVLASVYASSEPGNVVFMFMFKDGAISGFSGDTAGSRQRSPRLGATVNENINHYSVSFLDSPNTTSAITYDIRLTHDQATSRTVFVNRAQTDTDANSLGRAASNITAMEVAG
jgi:hypothetical protein